MDDALRRELGAHLRAAREVVDPADVGLAGGGRRRTPGLRREEVAALAGVSVAWYTWLEQGRASTTRQVLDAICRVLGMDTAAHRHTLALAGFMPAAPVTGEAVLGESTRALLDSWTSTPAAAVDARFDVLAGNAAYRRFWGDPDSVPNERRNLLIMLATRADHHLIDVEPLLRGLYEQFRANTGHIPDDPRAAAIVDLLRRERPDAGHWWSCRAVREFAPVTAGRFTFCLLRPVGEEGVYIFTQLPA
ncbi:helix-turn-helix domain-containing protein [Streptosporangium sp. NPDC051022]|uniref:helix-turn-helix domain-containing protein n=1 Tax=Streptosporangium sp. NPDC051022 TaxID=3155752 RepID=UPI0034121257